MRETGTGSGRHSDRRSGDPRRHVPVVRVAPSAVRTPGSAVRGRLDRTDPHGRREPPAGGPTTGTVAGTSRPAGNRGRVPGRPPPVAIGLAPGTGRRLPGPRAGLPGRMTAAAIAPPTPAVTGPTARHFSAAGTTVLRRPTAGRRTGPSAAIGPPTNSVRTGPARSTGPRGRNARRTSAMTGLSAPEPSAGTTVRRSLGTIDPTGRGPRLASGRLISVVIGPSDRRTSVVIGRSGRRTSVVIGRSGRRTSATIGRSGRRISVVIGRSGRRISVVIGRSGRRISVVIGPSGRRISVVIGPSGRRTSATISLVRSTGVIVRNGRGPSTVRHAPTVLTRVGSTGVIGPNGRDRSTARTARNGPARPSSPKGRRSSGPTVLTAQIVVIVLTVVSVPTGRAASIVPTVVSVPTGRAASIVPTVVIVPTARRSPGPIELRAAPPTVAGRRPAAGPPVRRGRGAPNAPVAPRGAGPTVAPAGRKPRRGRGSRCVGPGYAKRRSVSAGPMSRSGWMSPIWTVTCGATCGACRRRTPRSSAHI